MIVYSATKTKFVEDVLTNNIDGIILDKFKHSFNRAVGAREIASWRNSMNFMSNILVDEEIPKDAGVAIEYNVPQTSKRIDFILTGKDRHHKEHAIIIELKQWTEAKTTTKDAIVQTFLGRSEIETNHPSYQAWSYAALLEDFNETVRNEHITLKPCAYLHNCISYDVINNAFYQSHILKAPTFLKNDASKLKAFIKQFVKYGDANDIMYRIDHGKIKPSKNLADSLLSLLQGNQEFLMIDDQKLVYETALELSKKSKAKQKHVLLVEGGPGTGKSVVAINLLVALTAKELNVQYVTKNSAPRAVYESKLAGTYTKTRIGNLFKGSGAYTACEKNIFDVLLVDEAHRLNAKSGMFQNLGENQVKEIIDAAACSVFFIDEDQRVTLKDIGEKAEIHKWAKACGATVHELALQSQFRCNGSNGYLSWLDQTLQVRNTANDTLEGIDYEFLVCSSPTELRDKIFEKNLLNNKARLVAGYCWDWTSKKDSTAMDIVLPEFNFAMQWNLASDGNLWILKPEAVKEVGCIHTCQGLEVDYIGVIIGPDFIVRDGVVQTVAKKRSKMDSSIKGFKQLFKTKPAVAEAKADLIIKNTYRTLMTRGQKGCYIFSTDPETNEYFQTVAKQFVEAKHVPAVKYPNLPLRLLKMEEVQPYKNSVPIFNLKIAAGNFSATQTVEECDWVELAEPFAPKAGLFVARVLGESMNMHIPNGSWCLFKTDTGGTRQGKIVLVQHRNIQDADMGGQYTIKAYHSVKVENDDGTWAHSKIILKPQTTHLGYKEIVFEGAVAGELQVVGELVAVIVR